MKKKKSSVKSARPKTRPKKKIVKQAKKVKKSVPHKLSSIKAVKTSPFPADYQSLNIPQSDSLLSEIEYGEGLAPYFDTIYSESVIRQIQEPFYKMLIGKYTIQSACDLSCRTGQTLHLLEKLGLKTLAGVDVSPAMIERSKKKTPKADFYQSDLFLAPQTIGDRKFDLVLCTKDSLPLVLDDEALLNFFVAAKSLLTDNGVLLIEMWNYEKIWRKKERFMPIMDRNDEKQNLLFFLENDFHQELLVRNTIRLERNAYEWYLRPLSVPARPITRNELDFFIKEAGFSKWGFLGSYAGTPYNPSQSPYCMMIGRK